MVISIPLLSIIRKCMTIPVFPSESLKQDQVTRPCNLRNFDRGKYETHETHFQGKCIGMLVSTSSPSEFLSVWLPLITGHAKCALKRWNPKYLEGEQHRGLVLHQATTIGQYRAETDLHAQRAVNWRETCHSSNKKTKEVPYSLSLYHSLWKSVIQETHSFAHSDK